MSSKKNEEFLNNIKQGIKPEHFRAALEDKGIRDAIHDSIRHHGDPFQEFGQIFSLIQTIAESLSTIIKIYHKNQEDSQIKSIQFVLNKKYLDFPEIVYKTEKGTYSIDCNNPPKVSKGRENYKGSLYALEDCWGEYLMMKENAGENWGEYLMIKGNAGEIGIDEFEFFLPFFEKFFSKR